MSLKNRQPHRRFKKTPVWLLLCASPFIVSRALAAPGIIANPAPPAPLTPPAMEGDVTNNPMSVFFPSATANNSLPQPFQYGPFTVRPHIDYNFLYGNGIQAAPTNQQATAIHQISPGLRVDFGTHWSLDYTPTIRLYSNSQFKDGVDEAASLTGGTHYEDWTFGLSQTFLYTTAPAAETGSQTEQQTFATGLNATRLINDKLSLNLALNQNFSYAENLQDSREWSTTEGLNYEFWPRLVAGGGVTFGYVNVDLGPDQTYEQLNADVSWRATDKLSFQLNGGVQDRQYSASSAADTFTPVFGAAIQYLPFADTQISVNASRSIAPSLIPGANTTSTSFGASVNQRLFKKFQLNVGGNYNLSKFSETGFDIAVLPNNELPFAQRDVGRTDDNYTFTARLSHPLLRRGTWAVFYQYNDNQSTAAGLSYKGGQIGVEFNYAY